MAGSGVLYIVTGQPAMLAEAEASADSARQLMPGSLSGKARILHAHRSKAEFIRVQEILNRSCTPRLVVRDAEVLYGATVASAQVGSA
ncbi:MAG: hypothetical protein AB1486_25480 [Planctomycetota bacterium]